MHVIKTISELKKELSSFRQSGANIGFVPTMGALHKGHLSLMKACVVTNDISVASIYINPTQFNDKNDLQNYPRDLDHDCEMLRETGCNLVFAPPDQEMYPEPDERNFDFGTMGRVMEGKHRPGHFNGVAQIVTRLFDLVEPDTAYFGQKDFQQLAIIRKLVNDLNYAITIVACPTIRESDGLAMSSRNTLLSEKARKSAPLIYQTLRQVKEQFINRTVSEIEEFVQNNINKSSDLELEYFQIVDKTTLQAIYKIQPDTAAVACIAVYAGKIRLIDNVELIS
jgi:pantoate--beta-alanine ligase